VTVFTVFCGILLVFGIIPEFRNSAARYCGIRRLCLDPFEGFPGGGVFNAIFAKRLLGKLSEVSDGESPLLTERSKVSRPVSH
jgi:hypothetical protein